MLDSGLTVDEIGADIQFPVTPKIAINEKAATALAEVAEWLERGGKHKGVNEFSMCTWRSRCGTVCCIAGALCEFNGIHVGMDANEGGAAMLALAIPEVDATELFLAGHFELHQIDRAWAARTIRHYIATGKVDWQKNRIAPQQ